MDNKDIIQLPKSMVEKVRMGPLAIFGSAGIEGCLHVVSEIIINSIEEIKKGFGDKIIINRYPDNSLEVIDFGRGIPVDYNEKAKKFNWDINFCQIDSVAYFEEEKHEYQFTVDLDECELFFAQAASEYMDAEIHRDGYKYTLHFEKGENIAGLKSEMVDEVSTGTRIKFKLDDQVFDETLLSYEALDDTVDKLATCNTGITFKLCYKSEGECDINKEYCYTTISEKIKKVNSVGISEIHEHMSCFSGEDRDKRKCQGCVNIAMAFAGNKAIRESYFNYRFLKYGGIAVDETERLIKEELKLRFYNSKNLDETLEKTLENVVKQFSIITCVKMTPEIAVMWTNGARSAIANPIVGETVAGEFGGIVKKMIDAYLPQIRELILQNCL